MADGVVERHAHVGEVEVLDAHQARVVEAFELGEHRGEIDVAVCVVGMELGLPGRGLAQLHVIGVTQEEDGILTPASRRGRCRG